MKILIDTNILVSTALFPESFAAKAFYAAVRRPDQIIICEYELSEMITVFKKKFPAKIAAAEDFVKSLRRTISIVPTAKGAGRYNIRDPYDEPILASAILYDADLILTGDKDFAAVDLKKPIAVTPREFLDRY